MLGHELMARILDRGLTPKLIEQMSGGRLPARMTFYLTELGVPVRTHPKFAAVLAKALELPDDEADSLVHEKRLAEMHKLRGVIRLKHVQPAAEPEPEPDDPRSKYCRFDPARLLRIIHGAHMTPRQLSAKMYRNTDYIYNKLQIGHMYRADLKLAEKILDLPPNDLQGTSWNVKHLRQGRGADAGTVQFDAERLHGYIEDSGGRIRPDIRDLFWGKDSMSARGAINNWFGRRRITYERLETICRKIGRDPQDFVEAWYDLKG